MSIAKQLSSYVIPLIFVLVLTIGMYKKLKIYDIFVENAKEGINTVLRILPSLVGLMVAISVFRASGALDLIIYAVEPISNFLGIPKQVLPLAFMRPLSGSASIAMVSDMLKIYGSDSVIGRTASTMMGSTETIFFTLTVYYGSVGIKNTRFTLIAALIAEFVSVMVSVWACKVF